MSKWVLVCKQCQKSFPHSEISPSLANYFMPEKPKFPAEGRVLECPNCNATFNYLRGDLRYEEARTR
jgi:hypothetical protein